MVPSTSKETLSSGTRIHPVWMLLHAIGVLVVPYYAGQLPMFAGLRPSQDTLGADKTSSILLSAEQNQSMKAETPATVITAAPKKIPQHLQVDLSKSSKSFLQNPEVFLNAIIKTTVNSSETSRNCRHLKNGSFHCSTIFEGGLSLSFHATPRAATLTYFITSEETYHLLPMVQKLDDLFQGKLEMTYYYKGHGDIARDTVGSRLGLPNPDFYDMVRLQESCRKEILLHESTGMQTVTVVEIPHSKDPHGSCVKGRNTYGNEARDAVDFPTRKMLLLDGITQSTLHGIEAYHEALVHMAMLSHPNPKRVAIIGGGEGATLREVLKFKSVEEATMVEIDAELITMAEAKLSEWNDCSDFILDGDDKEGGNGEYKSCFKDPRTNLVLTDAVGWFINHFGEKANTTDVEKFDLVIMDALDPASKSFSNILYGNPVFTDAFMDSLNDDGIFFSQFGETTEMEDEPMLDKEHSVFEEFLHLLTDAGAEKVKTFTEAHNEFEAPWAFLMVFKDSDTMVDFYAEPAWFDLKLAKQGMSLHSNKFPFGFIDGATAATYQYPSRVDEYVYCHQTPKPVECTQPRGFDATRPSVPSSALTLRESTIPDAGKGVFFTQDTPKGTLIAPEEGPQSIFFTPLAYDIMEEMSENYPGQFDRVSVYKRVYGESNEFLGWESQFSHTGIMTYPNHACNSSTNEGQKEITADVENGPVFSPYNDRNFHVRFAAYGELHHDAKAGEELLGNHLGNAAKERC